MEHQADKQHPSETLRPVFASQVYAENRKTHILHSMNVPIIVKLLLSLVIIITSNRYAKNLSFSLLLGTIFFAFWTGQSADSIIQIAAARISSWNTLTLLALVSLVIVLSGQMKKTGLIDIMVKNVRSRISTKTSMAVLPAIIGLLPMPGGALFSAPILDSFDGVSGVNQLSKTRINYWFRHIWEYSWPLYPGVLVTCDIAGIELGTFLLAGLPISAASVTLGYLFFLRKIPLQHNTRDMTHKISIKPFIPIITVIFVYAGIQGFAPGLGKINTYLPMLIGLTTAIVILQAAAPIPLQEWKELFFSKRLLHMVLIILMVRLYGAFIEADIQGISIVETMTREMADIGIPSLPLIMLLPFIAGLTMGVSVGYAGAAMPVIAALLGVDPEFGVLLGTILFAYVCGFMGTMLSPLHVCGIVSCEYYHTPMNKNLVSIIPPAVLMVTFGFLYSRLLEALL